jgi:hypothetical protein
MSQQQRQKAPIKAFTESRDESRAGYLDLPEGVKIFKLDRTGNAAYKLDFIPYIVGKGNPAADPGMEYFERTFYVHRKLGPDGMGSAICNLSTFRKRCRFCEHRDQLRKDGMSYKDTAELNPKTRIIFRVYDRGNKNDGIQIWETGDYKTFGAMLKAKIGAVEDYANFSDLEEGYTLQLSVIEDKFGENAQKYKAVTSIEMIKRNNPLPAEWLDEGPNLDDCIKPISDKAAMRLLNPGADEEEDEDAPKSSKPAKAKAKPTDDDEDEDPPAKPSKAKKPAPVDDDDADPVPVKTAKTKAAPPPDDEDDDDIPVKPAKGKTPPPSADDDDDDEMPPPPRGRR